MLMRRLTIWVMALIAIAFSGAADGPPFRPVPLAALLAAPKNYDSEPVQTSGYASETPRGLFLFLTRDDAQHHLVLNAIALEVDQSTQEGRRLAGQIHNQFVTVTGTFDWLGDGALVLREVSTGIVADRKFKLRFPWVR
jgi:hypothetical protein